MLAGALAGYAFGGTGASYMQASVLKNKSFDREIMLEQEVRQRTKTLNLAGYNQNYISGNDNHITTNR